MFLNLLIKILMLRIQNSLTDNIVNIFIQQSILITSTLDHINRTENLCISHVRKLSAQILEGKFHTV